MLNNEERKEFLRKHYEMQHRNRMRLLIMGSVFAGIGCFGMVLNPAKADAFVLVLLIGLCGTAIAALD